MTEQANEQTETQETNRPEPVDLDGFRSEVEWLRKELTDTRKEAGRYRTERNTLREEMKDAVRKSNDVQHQRWVERYRVETVGGHTHLLTALSGGGDHGDPRGEVAQRTAKGARIKWRRHARLLAPHTQHP